MPAQLLIRIVLWIWLLGAFYASQQGWLRRLPPPAFPGMIIALSALTVLAYNRLSLIRTWINSLDLRVLVALHLTRFVGIYFLLLYQRGELPYAFAVPGGWGDIIVAALALLVCGLPLSPEKRRRAITIWNVIGLIDILIVVSTAARLGLADPASMHALTYLPLSLLPTFLVPLIIATHIIIFQRLKAPSVATPPA